jgi:hypothetical protein
MQEQWRCLDRVIDLNLSPPHQMQEHEKGRMMSRMYLMR